MIEVEDGLYLGDDSSVAEFLAEYDYGFVVHAAKEPWHRQAVGYTGRGAPKDSPYYLFKLEANELFLNMVDAPSAKFFSDDMVDKAIECVRKCVDNGVPCLIHCNQGHSRSVMLGIIALCSIYSYTYDDAVEKLEDEGVEIQLGGGAEEYLSQLY